MRFSFAQSGIPESEFKSSALSLSSYLSRLNSISSSGNYSEPESSMSLSADEKILSEIKKVCAEKANMQLKYVIVIGIGGSELGAKAVYDALKKSGGPEMIFLGTTDEKAVSSALEKINNNVSGQEEVLIIVASKSGVTLETIADAEYLIGNLKNKFPGIENRVVAVTGENSPLWKSAASRGIATLSIPKKVGGRFSVFSAVGLLPLSAAGFDIEEFRAGALKMRDICLAPEFEINPAIKSATFLYYWRNNGKKIHDFFFFDPELESLGKWLVQLLGESIGKSEEAGITPIVSIGSDDLHSMSQLFLGGPKDKTAMLVANNADNDTQVPDSRVFPDIAPRITGKKFGKIMDAIREGVKISYNRNEIPFFEADLERLGPRELGGFMQWKMTETMFLGQLLGVNPFDQPLVEGYKKESARILEE